MMNEEVPASFACSSKLARSLLKVGSELFSKGFEKDAMALFESAHGLLHQPSSSAVASAATSPSSAVSESAHARACACRHLEMGSQLLLADTTQVDEDQFHSPDMYLEDECDVGPRVLRIPAHLEALASSASSTSAYESMLLDTALTFNKALIFHDNLDFSQAKRMYQVVLHSLQSMLVNVNVNVNVNAGSPSNLLLEIGTRAHNNLGHICYMAGEEDVARAHFEASLMCARQLISEYNNSSPSTQHRLAYASVLSNWCRVSWMRGDISDSLYHALSEVLRVRSSLLKWNHVDVATAHFNIAVAEYARRRNPSATTHLMQYLQVVSDHAQDKLEDLDPIPALIYLLLIQNEENDDSLSQELVRGLRTLQDKRQDQGPDSPEVASVLNFIGTLLFHKEDYHNALLFFQEELRLEENMCPETAIMSAISSSTIGGTADDISVSVTCNNIGRILQELGKLNEAVHYYRRALRPQYGDITTTTANTTNSSSCATSPCCKLVDDDEVCPTSSSSSSNNNNDSNNKSEEKEHAGEEGNKKKKSNPSSANLYSTVWYNLGLIHDKLGSYVDAIAAFQMSLGLRRAMLGNDHPDIACLMYNIGVLQMEQQLLNEATDSFREALRIRCGGATGQLNDKHIVKTLEKLSSLHKAKGNIAGALEALQEVLHIQEISLDYRDDSASRQRETGVTLRSMAELHHATGNLHAALVISSQSVHKLQSVILIQQQQQQQTTTTIVVDPVERVAVIEQLVSSLLFVGSLYHEMCEPLHASAILREAVETLRDCRNTSMSQQQQQQQADLFASLDALQEVTIMLATTHCAAEA